MDYTILLGGDHAARTFGRPTGYRGKCCVCRAEVDKDCIPTVRDVKHLDACLRARPERAAEILRDAPERYRFLWEHSASFRFYEPEQRVAHLTAERAALPVHESHKMGEHDTDPLSVWCEACLVETHNQKASAPCEGDQR